MSYVNAAMAVVSLYQGYESGKTAKAQGALQKQADDYQATIEEANGNSVAAIIRRAGKRTVGAANAAYAGAGVKVGEGSAGVVEGQIEQDVEHDAYQAILEGNRRGRGMRVQGQQAVTAGRLRAGAAYVNATASAMSSVSRAGGGWKTAGAYDAGGVNGTNDRGFFSVGSNYDWHTKYGVGGD